MASFNKSERIQSIKQNASFKNAQNTFTFNIKKIYFVLH